jgi:WD40 repeat protein
VAAKKKAGGPARRVVDRQGRSLLAIDGWSAVASLAIAPGGRLVAGQNGGYGVACWDASGTIAWQVKLAKAGTRSKYEYESRLAVCGNELAAFENYGALHVLDLATGKTKRKPAVPKNLRGIAFTPDGKTIVCRVHVETDLLAWPSMKKLVHFDQYCNGDSIAISPDGKWLAVNGHEIHVFDLAKKKHVKTWEPAEQPWSMCFTASSGHLVTGDSKNMLRLYDADNGFAEVKAVGKNRAPTLTAVATSPNGKWIATANDLGTVIVHKAGTLEVAHELKGHDPSQPDTGARSIAALAFADESTLVVGAAPKKQPAGLTLHTL